MLLFHFHFFSRYYFSFDFIINPLAVFFSLHIFVFIEYHFKHFSMLEMFCKNCNIYVIFYLFIWYWIKMYLIIYYFHYFHIMNSFYLNLTSTMAPLNISCSPLSRVSPTLFLYPILVFLLISLFLSFFIV